MIKPVIVDTTGGRVVGPAIPVEVLTSAAAAGIPVEGKLLRVVQVTDADIAAGRAKVVGGRPIPVILGVGGVDDAGAPAQQVYVVSGSLATNPALLKQTTAATAATASWNVPVSSSQGSLLVALIGVRSASSVSISGVTDSAGNVWTKVNSSFHVGVNGRIEMWYAKNAAPISSITVTPSGSVAMSVNALEFSNINITAPLDQSAIADDNGVTTFDAGTTGNTAQAVEVVIAAGAHTTTNTESLDTGTFNPLTRAGASTNCVVIGAYRITSQIATQRATWTMSGATTGGGIIASFKGV